MTQFLAPGPHTPVIQLCIAITQAEFRGQIDEARGLALQAWKAASDDYEACLAAHYLARFQDDPADALRWNSEALHRADAANDERALPFYPSLYVNMAYSHELLGNEKEAKHYYELAAALGLVHTDPSPAGRSLEN